MAEHGRGGLWEMAGWLAFPVVPALLATTYSAVPVGAGRDDPRLWEGWDWPLRLGPLYGFGFLAGATLGLPDDPSRRGLWSWPSRRAAWVAIGPWVGLLFWAGVYYGLVAAAWVRDALLPASWVEGWPLPTIRNPWVDQALLWTILGTLSHGWLAVAWPALRRARRLRRLGRAIGRGLLAVTAFVGSLVGGFWAVTAAWRDYFFDARLAPALLLSASALALAGGCAHQPTLGDVRRRELFQAMTMAWVVGLALAWRWWSRRRSRRIK
jgi:hypothetical protein